MFGLFGGTKWLLIVFSLNGQVGTFEVKKDAFTSQEACTEFAASLAHEDNERFGYTCMSEHDQKIMMKYGSPLVFAIEKEKK